MERFKYHPARPPSGAIPRFPIWEVVVTLFLIVAGVQGLFNDPSTNVLSILGTGAYIWYITLAVCGIVSLTGMAVPAPDGLIIHLIAMVVLFVGAGAVLVSFIALTGNFVFTGSISLYIFTIGAIARTIQILGQLNRLRNALTNPPNPRWFKE